MNKVSRIAVLAAAIVAGFYFFTTHGHVQPASQIGTWISRPAHVELTEAAAQPNFDTDEQNNITVYRRVLPSVVSVAAPSATLPPPASEPID